jgi:5-methyltetrahydrofolate--homocysteine methyltransferase
MTQILDEIKRNLIAGRVDSEDEGFDDDVTGEPGVTELVEQALENGVSPADILTKALTPGMDKVGELFEQGEYLVPDMLASAECVAEATTILKPHLVGADVENKGKFVIATVEEDLHDIGKNILGTILFGSGYDVQDLGTSVKSQTIVDAVKRSNAQYLGLSALLTSTMGHMGEVIALLKESGLRENVTVCVGGAPISDEFARQIGADLYGEDAFDALRKLEKLV